MVSNSRKSSIKRLIICGMILAALLCSTVFTIASGGRLNTKIIPIDEAKYHSEFSEFRTQLIAAIKRKDVDFIKSHTDLQIKYGYRYQGSGLESFIKHWHLHENPEKSKFWEELEKVLVLGGVFTGEGIFVTPYLYALFPDYDQAYDHAVVTGQNVNVREKSSLQSRIVTQVSYDIVQLLKWDIMHYGTSTRESNWVKIKTVTGKTGYINAQFLRNPFDYRAGFAKRDGEWKMIFFVNGD